MRSIMGELRTRFSFEADAEVAIEIDPRTLSEEMARTLGECGFNRASLGVQSFDIRVQRAINRVQSFEQTREAMRLLRANGMKRINFDLIYGLPNQSLQSCLDTVEQAVTLRPDRLAVFGYAHVPAFKPHQRKIDEAALPDSDARFTHSRAIADALVRAGYVEIGLDHFALPDDPLAQAAVEGRLHRNFQGYTTDEAEVLIGLGASSIGRMPQGYVQNETRIPVYQRIVAEGRLPIARGYRFEGEDRLRGAVIERLMCDQSRRCCRSVPAVRNGSQMASPERETRTVDRRRAGRAARRRDLGQAARATAGAFDRCSVRHAPGARGRPLQPRGLAQLHFE